MSINIEPSQMGKSTMGNSVSTTHLTAQKTKKYSASNRFQDLWARAEKAREDNHQLEESLDALVVQVLSEIAPYEQKLGLAMRQQVFKLITFSSRKSLLQWQRAMLDEWITESMSTLHDLGLVDSELIDHLARADAKLFNITIDENSDVLAVDQLRAAVDEQSIEQSDPDHDVFDEDLERGDDQEEFDFQTWCEEQLKAEGLSHEDDSNWQGAADDNDKNDESKLEESKALFKTLFRRAARALHPDKVTDLKEKEARQSLMTQLLEARRNQDLMTVFELYSEYVDSSVDFSEQDLAELEEVLHRFIEMQSEKRFELITKSPMHNMAFDLFYAKSQATTNRKIKKYLKDIDSKVADMEMFTDTVKSLKSLKPYLEARHDSLFDYFSIDTPGSW